MFETLRNICSFLYYASPIGSYYHPQYHDLAIRAFKDEKIISDINRVVEHGQLQEESKQGEQNEKDDQ